MALFAAISNKDTFAAKLIIQRYPETVNDIDEKGYAPLIRASHKHLVEVVKELVKHGANVNAYIRVSYMYIYMYVLVLSYCNVICG